MVALAVVMAPCDVAGQQIEPNPNPGLISIPDDGDMNLESFINQRTGRVEADGGASFGNFAPLENLGVIDFSNVANFDNHDGRAELKNAAGGTVQFVGGTTFENRNTARTLNQGAFTNRGLAANVINSIGGWFGNDTGAIFRNAELAVFTNRDLGELVNTGEFTNDGATLINESRSFLDNRSLASPPPSARMTNTNGGSLLNRALLHNHRSAILSNQVGSLFVNEAEGEVRNFESATLNNSGIGSVFRNEASVSNGGSGSQIFNVFSATLSNEGEGATFSNEGGASLTNRSGGTLVNRRSAALSNRSGATLTNTGNGTTLRNEAGATLTNELGGILLNEDNALIENDATIDNKGGGTEFRIETAAEVANSGTLRNQDGALLVNGHEIHVYRQGALINEAGGRLENEDEITSAGLGSAITNRSGATMTNAGIILNTSGCVFTNRDNAEIINTGSPGLMNSGTAIDPVPAPAQWINENATIRNGGSTSFVNEMMAILVNRGIGARVFFQVGASLVNRTGAQFLNSDNARLVVDFSSSIVNSAIFVNEARIENGGTFENSGLVTLGAGSTLSSGGIYRQTGGTTVVEGLLAQRNVELTGGVLSGGGTVLSTAAPVAVGPGATVAPGNSVGTLTIDGDLYCSGGTLEIEIGAEGRDQLRVLGTAEFVGGTIVLSFRDGFVPAVGSTYPAIDATSAVGLETLQIALVSPPSPELVFQLRADGAVVVSQFRVLRILHLGDRVEVDAPVGEADATYRLIRHSSPDFHDSGLVVDTIESPDYGVITLVDDGAVQPLLPERAFYLVEITRN